MPGPTRTFDDDVQPETYARVRPLLECTLRVWPLRQRIRLAAEKTAPRRARDFLAAVCADWDARGYADVGGLLLSELVSNAVRHVGGEIEVTLQLADGRLTIAVHDDGDGTPAVVPAARRTIGGNGLDIVSRLAESWGTTPDPQGGKTVWCVLAAESAAASRVVNPAQYQSEAS